MTEIYSIVNEQISELVSEKLYHLEEVRKIDSLIDVMKGAKGRSKFSANRNPYTPPVSRVVFFPNGDDAA